MAVEIRRSLRVQGGNMRIAAALSLLAPFLFVISASLIVVDATAANETPELVAIPAFPGAEGFGWHALGGRGGTVYEVTNLNDSGPGSLRDAVSQPHRTIVFRISGDIDLQSQLVVREPFITIAGQTAPGDGICLRYYTFAIQTHDCVVRYLRSRLGDQHGQESDSITIGHGCRDVILDHCSATWSVDENLSTAGID